VTKTCPNCKVAKDVLKDEKYILIDAEENYDLAGKYQVMQAPTLVVVNKGEYLKFSNVSAIKNYMQTVLC